MKIKRDEIHNQSDRHIYWIQLSFVSDGDSKKSIIFAAASYEYLDDFYRIEDKNHLKDEHFDDWIQRIEKNGRI